MPTGSSTPRHLKLSWIWIALALLMLGTIGGLALVAQGSDKTAHVGDHPMTMPNHFPTEPVWYRNAPGVVKNAYVEAAYHRSALQYIPCYCGCGEIHANNSACYFQQNEQGEATAFDQHAYACQVCVDITYAVVDGLNQGKSVFEIRQEIDKKYEVYGFEPTPTPMPPVSE